MAHCSLVDSAQAENLFYHSSFAPVSLAAAIFGQLLLSIRPRPYIPVSMGRTWPWPGLNEKLIP